MNESIGRADELTVGLGVEGIAGDDFAARRDLAF
jgi:hypothetical protein